MMVVENIRAGVSWVLLTRLLSNIAQVLIYISLARFMSPSEFGLMAAAAVVVNFASMFTTSGLSAANIQAKNPSSDTYSSIFYLSFFLSFLVYLCIYVFAPFFEKVLSASSGYAELIRLLGFGVILGSINGMQISQFQRALNFKLVFWVSSLPVLISGFVSVFLAFLGWGVYALVLNVILGKLIGIILCSRWVPIFPPFLIDSSKIRDVFSFSGFIFMQGLIDEVYKSTLMLSIGKFFGSEILGVVNLGRQIPMFVTGTINAAFASLFFPAFSRIQEDGKDCIMLLRKSSRFMNFIVVPFVATCFLLPIDVVVFVLGGQWVEALKFIQYFSVILGVHHLYSNSIILLNAKGKSLLSFCFVFLTRFFGVLLILSALEYQIDAVILSQILYVIIAVVFIVCINHFFLGYYFYQFLADFCPCFFAGVMSFVVSLVFLGFMGDGFLIFILGLFLFLMCYLLMCFWFGCEALIYLVSMARKRAV